MGLAAAFLGCTIVVCAIVWYFHTIHQERVPRTVGPFAGVLSLGMAVALGGAVLAPSWPSGLLTAVGWLLGGFILYLLPLRKLPDGALVVKPGDAMPPLEAVDHTGSPFTLASLRGQRVLLKFFRGHW